VYQYGDADVDHLSSSLNVN